ncbi:hypothetical protein IFT67_12570 [Sphingomonas sp. CFBP 13728]|uniref:hypothetical protein n=1 Tax=Sphingomonas sp. CFBP 13728 TaxID=2775294 RepID=UPI00178009D0|nr:hypothetical protein [Sphingomonas sp. CFBP 13728]MBD8619756.1 hypothetical protein [Sphingomonas sp. CFBP 13728]
MFGGGSDIVAAADGGHEYSIGLRARQEPPFPRSLLWESFWEVHTMRPPAFSGVAPIPLDKIEWYARHELGFDDDEAEAFKFIMRRADNVFVNEIAKKQAANSNK